ncbi:MAG: hypothetical protein L0Y39_04250 [Methylococcaceae bacterium]|nr:hypothetical protein [Methylococcaceae bacterium]
MSAKKRPGENELRGMLLEGHFGRPRELRPADPITPTHMHLEIDRIKPYEHNPRRLGNPLYPQIKASIRSKRGLDDPIGITRRPGDALYTVRAGGNTRLSILKELWLETEDPVFGRAYCLFVPWISESDCITAHLIENELRGELAFIDKALALRGLLEQLEAESGASLSRSEFVRRLAEIGYPISRRQMIRYEYAAEALEPIIPEALEAGLGCRQIDEIREAETRYRDYWNASGLAAKEFDGLFRSTLAEHDSDSWNLRLALDDLEIRISGKIGKAVNTVRLEVDGLIAGIQAGPPDGEDPPGPEPGETAAPSGPPEPPAKGHPAEEFNVVAPDSRKADQAAIRQVSDPDHGSAPAPSRRIDAERSGGDNRFRPATRTSDPPEPDLKALDEEAPATSFRSGGLNGSSENRPPDYGPQIAAQPGFRVGGPLRPIARFSTLDPPVCQGVRILCRYAGPARPG